MKDKIYLFSRIFLVTFLIVSYYKFFKDYLYNVARRLSYRFSLIYNHPLTKITGMIEICLISSTHVLFCFFLCLVLGLSPKDIGLLDFTWMELLYGGMLGLGVMAVATLMCRVIMEILKYCVPDVVTHSMKSWVVMARGGWMRHHTHALQILPLYIALFLILMQIGSEEIVFRGILISYFSQFGQTMAIVCSTSLFVLIQFFQTPGFKVAIFPMVGALTMGIIFSILFIKTHALLPLIISHFTFFILAVL